MITLESLANKGYEATELANRIFLIEHFLTDSEIEQLLNIAKSATQEDWEGHYFSNMVDFCRDKFGRTDIENLLAEGKIELTHDWGDKILNIENLLMCKDIQKRVNHLLPEGLGLESSVVIMQRQYSGTKLVEHVDNDTDPSLTYASVAYLNDDYKGGKVFFSKFGVSLNPKPGSFLIFPTKEDWTHGVDEVLDGPVRYVLPIFIRKPDFYKDNKY